MRPHVLAPGLCLALAACTTPNPAYHATGGVLESSSSTSPSASGTDPVGPGSAGTVEPATDGGSTATNAASGSETGTTEPVATTSTTATTGLPHTSTGTSLATDATATTDTTEGTDATSMGSSESTDTLPKLDMPQMAMCSLVPGPGLEVTITHSPPPATCNAPLGPVFYGVYESKPNANSVRFRECQNFNDCLQGNVQCAPKQTVTVHVNAAAWQIPTFAPGACVNISYLGTGYSGGDTCNTRLLRLARAGSDILNASVFVSGTGVPESALLPDPWPNILEFTVESVNIEPCADGQVCGQQTGNYDLLANFSGQNIVVPEQMYTSAKVPLYNKSNVKIGDVHGIFANVRSHAHPNNCEFRWLWLADDNKP